MIDEIIKIIEVIKTKVSDSSDMVWTGYDSGKGLRDELDGYIKQLKTNDISCLTELQKHFLPTSTFQEHSISNGWADEYIHLANQFDKLHSALNR